MPKQSKKITLAFAPGEVVRVVNPFSSRKKLASVYEIRIDHGGAILYYCEFWSNKDSALAPWKVIPFCADEIEKVEA